MMAQGQGLKYDRRSYLFQEVFSIDPEIAEERCSDLLKNWESSYCNFKDNMDSFKKRQCLMLIWLSDKFQKKNDTRMDRIDEAQTYRQLSGQYDDLTRMISGMNFSQVRERLPHDAVDSTDAEEDRFSQRQMEQYMLALIFLFDKAQKGVILSEELIKNVHHILMAGLQTAGSEIVAGEYRKCSVTSGSCHMYIDYQYIPKAMPKMVQDFNAMKSSGGKCDMFERASWLLFELLSIHPFVDGNGRLSRLFWCYSLILDGLPFPVSPFAGLVSKPYKQYIRCITKDESIFSSKRCHLKAMTLISVYTTWRNFASNLKYENSDAYEKVTAIFKET